MGVRICSMFCCMLLYVHSSFAITLMGKRELDALLSLFSWCVAHPRGAMGLSAVCDCSISDHTLYFDLPLCPWRQSSKSIVSQCAQCYGHYFIMLLNR